MKISSLHSCNDQTAMRMKARMCGNLKGGFYRDVYGNNRCGQPCKSSGISGARHHSKSLNQTENKFILKKKKKKKTKKSTT